MVKRANDTQYGLGGAVFTKDIDKVKHSIRKNDEFLNDIIWTVFMRILVTFYQLNLYCCID